jgi:hypothetical protein
LAHYCLKGHRQTAGEILSPSRQREAPCEGTNSARLFTPGERNAPAKSKVHQISWAHGSPFMCGRHRYRRPRLLTLMYSITHATRKHEYSKWRLNRSKIIGRYREKSCFLNFASSYSFRSRSITLFWKELTVSKVLDEYLYNLSSTKTK